MPVAHARPKIKHTEADVQFRERDARVAPADRERQECHVCRKPWSPCGFGAPGLRAVRWVPARFYCTAHEAWGRDWHRAFYEGAQ